MALINLGGLITVNTLTDRDNIEFKVNGLRVEVLDTTGDPKANGKAIYCWTTSDNSWVLVSEETDLTEIEAKLASDDIDLDTLQEIVDLLKLNKSRLDNLTTPKIYIQNTDPTSQETVQENSIWIQIP